MQLCPTSSRSLHWGTRRTRGIRVTRETRGIRDQGGQGDQGDQAVFFRFGSLTLGILRLPPLLHLRRTPLGFLGGGGGWISAGYW